MKTAEVQEVFDKLHQENDQDFWLAIKALEDMVRNGQIDLFSVMRWWKTVGKETR